MSYTLIDDRAFNLMGHEYSEFEAYCWLVKESRPEPDGTRVVNHSSRFISKAWGWSRGKVLRFFGTLRDQKMIQIRAGKAVILQGDRRNGRPKTGPETGPNYNKYNKQRNGKWVVSVD